MEATTCRRKTRRFPMACSVQYFTLQGAGQGTLIDVSLEGAEIRGDLSLQTGALLSLVLYLPDGHAPAKINGSSVQWAKDHRFAVKFPPMPETWKKRLMTCCGIPVGEDALLFEDPTATVELAPRTVVPAGVTVLMVHENPNLLDLSAGILREEGFTVVSATDSQAALARLETYAGDIDLLVADVRRPAPRIRTQPYEPMEKPTSHPRLHGVELARWLTSRITPLRVIMMSTETPQCLLHAGISIGTLPFLALPFSRDALMRTIRQVLREPPMTPQRFERPSDRTCFGRLRLNAAEHDLALVGKEAA